jgi:hypothetical protein
MIERVREAFNKGALLQEFIPVPKELMETVSGSVPEGAERDAHEAQMATNRATHGYKDWYDWCVNEWGTKWDVGADGQPAIDNDTNTLVLNFDSAWAPPIQAYEKLFYMGFKILAYNYEPGMAFAGIFEDGADEYYEYGGMNSDQIAEELPAELDECFGISQSVSEWEQEQEEENIDIDLDGGLSAVNEQEELK